MDLQGMTAANMYSTSRGPSQPPSPLATHYHADLHIINHPHLLPVSLLPPLFPPPIAMVGPIRRTKSPPPVEKDPPRPPNAWILYRSDTLRALPPPPPGQPRRAQSDVSKLISAMWKNESAEVRAKYDRLSEDRKIQHYLQYPDYRFRPKKKAEKERIREEARLEKAEREKKEKEENTCPSPYTTPFLSSAHTPYFVAAAISAASTSDFSRIGPSPPLAAKSYSSRSSRSPSTHSKPTPDLNFAPLPSSSGPVAFNPQSAINTDAGSSASRHPSYTMTHTLSFPPTRQPSPPSNHLSAPQTDSWQLPTFQQDESSSTDSSTPSTSTSSASSNPWSFNQDMVLPTFDASGSESVSFPMSSITSPWGGEVNDQLFADAMQATASATDYSSIYQMSGLDQNLFMSEPPAEIEVSVGQAQPVVSEQEQQAFAQLLQDLQFAAVGANGEIQWPQMEPDIDALNALQNMGTSAVGMDALLMGTPKGAGHAADSMHQQRHPQHEYHHQRQRTSSQDFLQYLNLDQVAPSQAQTHYESQGSPSMHAGSFAASSYPTPASIASSPAGPYVPPTGASNASTRRVAGSWRPYAGYVSAPDSPVEHAAPLQAWGVHTC